MANFYRLIKTMSNFDTLTLAVDDDDINKLIIKLENGDKLCVCVCVCVLCMYI